MVLFHVYRIAYIKHDYLYFANPETGVEGFINFHRLCSSCIYIQKEMSNRWCLHVGFVLIVPGSGFNLFDFTLATLK